LRKEKPTSNDAHPTQQPTCFHRTVGDTETSIAASHLDIAAAITIVINATIN